MRTEYCSADNPRSIIGESVWLIVSAENRKPLSPQLSRGKLDVASRANDNRRRSCTRTRTVSRVNEQVEDFVGGKGGSCRGTRRSPRGWKGTVILATETGTGGGREGYASSLRRIKPERLSLRWRGPGRGRRITMTAADAARRDYRSSLDIKKSDRATLFVFIQQLRPPAATLSLSVWRTDSTRGGCDGPPSAFCLLLLWKQ